MNKYILIFLGVALVAVAAFFIFRKKGGTGTVSNDSYQSPRYYPPQPVVAPNIPQGQPVLALPANVTQPRPPSISVKDGLTLAATVGCTAYTGGAGAPLCGIAAPLAVNAAMAGGKALVSGFKSLF